MSVQTAAAAGSVAAGSVGGLSIAACLLLPLSLALRRRRTISNGLAGCASLVLFLSALGCGARSISTAEVAQQVSTLQVTGTATNLAGTVVTHSATVTLIVQ
jgi:hypothetical protein